MTKPGWQTTEFWLTFVAVAVNGLIASDILAPGSVELKLVSTAAAALAAIGYTGFRTQAKRLKE